MKYRNALKRELEHISQDQDLNNKYQKMFKDDMK